MKHPASLKAPVAIGVDIGGTHTRVARINIRTGRIQARLAFTTPTADPLKTLEHVRAACRTLVPSADVPLGMAVAAQLDAQRRRVRVAPNLRWTNVDLHRLVAKNWLGPVAVENDVRAAAWGESQYGCLRAARGSAVCVFWGSGIGGALWSRGRAGAEVSIGLNAQAGEVGHLRYRGGGRRCGCGLRGCFEAYFGGHALAARAKKIGIHSTQALFESARGPGHQLAREAVTGVALLCAQICTLCDPGWLVLGGGLGIRHAAAIEQQLRALCLPAKQQLPRVVTAKLGDDAGVLGAAYLASMNTPVDTEDA